MVRECRGVDNRRHPSDSVTDETYDIAKKHTESQAFKTLKEARDHQRQVIDTLRKDQTFAVYMEETFDELPLTESLQTIITTHVIMSDNKGGNFAVRERNGDRYVTSNRESEHDIRCRHKDDASHGPGYFMIVRKDADGSSTRLIGTDSHDEGVGKAITVEPGFHWILLDQPLNQDYWGFEWFDGNLEIYTLLVCSLRVIS